MGCCGLLVCHPLGHDLASPNGFRGLGERWKVLRPRGCSAQRAVTPLSLTLWAGAPDVSSLLHPMLSPSPQDRESGVIVIHIHSVERTIPQQISLRQDPPELLAFVLAALL